MKPLLRSDTRHTSKDAASMQPLLHMRQCRLFLPLGLSEEESEARGKPRNKREQGLASLEIKHWLVSFIRFSHGLSITSAF
jgi:hypothetical protein